MSSPYVKLGDRTLDQWKVTELKEELKRRKLTTKGLKEDLVKRLDEVLRNEMKSSSDDEDNDATESELPPEKTNKESNVSKSAKDSVDKEIDIVEKMDTKSESEIEAPGEDKVVKADSMPGSGAAELEGEQVAQLSAAGSTAAASETVEPVTALSGSQLENHGTNEDGDSASILNSDGLPQEDAKYESSDPITQKENDDSKYLPPDSSVQPMKYQVSEVNPDSGFQVTSDSISTESISIIEKNELKIDVITDNVQLELDVKHEMAQPSPSSAVPDGGESHPMDVEEPLNNNDIEEPLDKKDGLEEPLDKKDGTEEPLDKKEVLEELLEKKENIEATGSDDPVNVDGLKGFDGGDMGHPEKLNLDRSSGDDSMEEDVLESKQMEEKSDTYTDSVGKLEIPIVKEEDHVDVVGHDKPVEIKVTDAENETLSALTPGKRKFQDKGVAGNNEVKKVRRWNAEGVKNSEPQSGSVTPKGLFEPNLKPISGTNNTVHAEAPKERLVPPPLRSPSNSLRINNFLRPFTLKAVQELLGKTGTVTSFWMDHIKTHCYVSYASIDEAVETRNAVYNLQWPPNGGRLLAAEFVDPQEVKSRLEAPPASPATPSGVGPTFSTPQHHPAVPPQPSPRLQVQRQPLPPPASLPPPPLSNPPPIRERLHPPREQPLPARDRLNLPPPPPLPEKVEPPIVTLDDLFRKTKATPRIYYLPLSEEQVASKLKTQGKNVNQ